ncbi:MAG: amidohydrolase family protein [Phycisphaerales bacterium]
MGVHRVRDLAATGAALLFAATSFAAPPPAKIALTNARIIPVVGEEIPNGTILVEYGKIKAVGSEVELPYDAMEIDVAGKVVMPGMIDPHSWRGLDVPNESVPVAPFLDVADALDPSRLFFEDTLRDGITTVHVIQGNNTVIGGVSRIVRPIGMTPDEMTVLFDRALKLSVSPRGGSDRMQQLATFRETFFELDQYLDDLAEQKYEESLSKDDKKIDVGPEEARKRGRDLIEDRDYDDQHANLIRLRRGDLDAWVYCGAAMDVGPAIGLAREHGFLDQTVFVLDVEAHKAVGELKEAGRPVVLPSSLTHRERDPISGEISETFIPAKLHDAGLMFALQPNPDDSLAERYLTYQAALCVRNGIPRHVALESITLNPAKMIGLDDHLGSIEVGKTANLVVLSGDPLDFSSWVERVYIDGVEAYSRDDDPRLKELLGLDQRRVEAEAAAAAEEAAAIESDASDEPAGGDDDASDDSDSADDAAEPAGDEGDGA